MKLRGQSLAAVALCVCLAVSRPAIAEPAYAQSTKYNVDISGGDLTTALPALSRQTGVVVLYPYDLAQVRSNPVKGLYTVPEALQLMFQGTGFSGDVSAWGAVSISRQRKRCDTEGEAMLRDSKSTVSVIALLASLFSWPACAQNASASAGESQGTQATSAEPVEAVVVTGSRVITNIANSPTPLTTVSTDQIAQMDPTSVPNSLIQLPMLAGSVSMLGDGQTSTTELNLRNFGANRTLVLLDGQRVTPSNSDGTVGLETLPLALMTRVDVVTGGASAVYGSDAITGVVNFILDKNFDGIKADFNSGISSYGDGASYKFSGAAGTSLFGGRGHIEVAVSSQHDDLVPMFARPYGPQDWAQTGEGTVANPFTNTEYATRPSAPFGGVVTCAACSVSGYEFTGAGVLTPFNAGTLTGTNNVNSGGDGGYNKYGTAINGQHDNNIFTRFSYDVNDNTTFYVEGTASEEFEYGYEFPIKIGPGITGTFFKNNPFLTPTEQAELGNNGLSNSTNEFSIGEFVDGGPGEEDGFRGVNRLLSVSTGLDGAWRQFKWNLQYSHGENRQDIDEPYNSNYQTGYAAQDAVLGPNGKIECYAATQAATAAQYANCVPINPFGPTSMTPSMINYITGETWNHLTNTMDDVSASIAGSLFDDWAGPVTAALSAEARFMSLTNTSYENGITTQAANCTGLRICSTGTTTWMDGSSPMHASDNVWEVALETDVPLLKDLPLAQSLDVNLAGRYTDYSISGAVQTWKVGVDYHVNDTIRFRGTESVDIRAPNLYELFQPASVDQQDLDFDLHTDTQGVTKVVMGGNANLTPEVAYTTSAGVVLTPDFIPGLSTSVDGYQVHLHGAITQVSGTDLSIEQLCESSGGTSPYCSLYVRPLPFSNTTPANYPTLVYSHLLNSALAEIQGVDVEVNYAFEWFGDWSARLLGNYQPVNESQAFPGAPFTFTQVGPGNDLIAKTHLTGFLSYSTDGWTFGLQDRWIGPLGKVTTSSPTIPQIYAQPNLAAANYVGVNLQREFEAGGVDWTPYLNVQNIFNNKGVLDTNLAEENLEYPVAAEDDIMGRYFTLGVRIKL
jgi:iron complex outermembrane recepter protein